MRHEIVGQPDYAMVKVFLDAGEKIVAETGAMVAMNHNMSLETKAKGGIFSGIKRLLGGETFFLNTFEAKGGQGEIHFAPNTPGDLKYLHIEPGQSWLLQSGAFVAAQPDVQVDSKWGGAKSFFGGEGLFLLRAEGQGDLFIGSYGSIEEIDVEGSYTVDTGAVVAFDQGLDYRIDSVGGLKSLLFSGEGLVCRFHGNGKLYIQTRMPAPLAAFLHPFRPIKQKGDANDE